MSLIYELRLNIQYGLLGLLLGLAVNNLGKNIYHYLGIPNRKNLEIIVQSILCALVLALIKVYGEPDVVSTIKSQMAGIMFIAFFFGVQYISFNTIADLISFKDTTAARVS